MIGPVDWQHLRSEGRLSGLDELETFIVGCALAMPEPHISAAGVDLCLKVEAGITTHAAEDAAGESGVLVVVLRLDAFLVEHDVEMQPVPLPFDLLSLDVWQRLGQLPNLVERLFRDADACRMSSD